jgi:hypothetical protein
MENSIEKYSQLEIEKKSLIKEKPRSSIGWCVHLLFCMIFLVATFKISES